MPFPRDGDELVPPTPAADIVKAQALGREAVHARVVAGDCPYIGDRSSRGRHLAIMWFRGYRAEQQRISEAYWSPAEGDA